MNDITNSTRLWDIQNGRYSLCEFGLLRCSTMVARAWPVSVEVIQDWLLAAPRQTSPPSCFYDTSILRYPFDDLFQWKSMGRLLRCSKWLLWKWLDSFTMILRCWLVVWVKWARPLVSMTLWSRVMFNWKAFSSQWGNFGTLLPPGVQVLPHCVVCSYRARQPLQMWANFTFLRNPLSELWVCEFWLLRWSTMVARGVASVCWGDSGLAACCPESNEPTLMFLWHFYPEISLWSLSMEVNGTCC